MSPQKLAIVPMTMYTAKSRPLARATVPAQRPMSSASPRSATNTTSAAILGRWNIRVRARAPSASTIDMPYLRSS
jgi:hypothetical protein